MNTETHTLQTAETTTPAVEEAAPRRWLRPPVDVYEHDDRFELLVDVPGVSAEGIELEVEGQELRLRAVRDSDRGYHRVFTLGRVVDAGAIDAQVTNGVLTLVLPKAAEAQRRRIPVAG